MFVFRAGYPASRPPGARRGVDGPHAGANRGRDEFRPDRLPCAAASAVTAVPAPPPPAGPRAVHFKFRRDRVRVLLRAVVRVRLGVSDLGGGRDAAGPGGDITSESLFKVRLRARARRARRALK